MPHTPKNSLPLIGREEVLAELRQRLEDPEKDAAPVTLLVGSEGVGKSTLLHEAVKWAHEKGVLVLEGRALPKEVPQPYSLMLEAIRSVPSRKERVEDAKILPREMGLAGLGVRRSSWGGKASLPPPLALVALTPTFRSAEEREARLLQALSEGKGHVEQRRREIFDGLVNYLEDLGADHQLLLALEDLHLGDEESLDFLEYLAKRMGENHIRLVGTVLPTLEQPPAVQTLVDTLSADGLLHTVEVRPLTEAETQEYIGLLAPGLSFSEAIVTRWYLTTEGNPRFLERLVLGEIASLGPAAEGSGKIVDLPRGEMARLALHLDVRELKENERDVLSFACVLGKRFPFATLQKSSGEEEERLAEVLESLIHSGIIRETGDENYEFIEDKIRKEVYGNLDETRRRTLHRRVAEVLEKQPITGPQSVYELAQHWYMAGVDAKSLDYNLRAADLAKAAQAPEVAIVHLERALEVFPRLHPEETTGHVSLVVDLALQLDSMGEIERGVTLITSNMESAQRAKKPLPTREVARLYLYLGRLYLHGGELQKSGPILDDAIKILGAMEKEAALLGNAHRIRGSVAFYSGDYPLAQEHYVIALRLLESVGNPVDVARVRISLGNVQSLQPEVPLAKVESLYLSAAKVLEEHGNPGEAALAINNMGLVHMNAGDFPAAIRLMEQALKIADKDKNPRTMGWIECNLCDALIRDHQLQRAEAENRKAKEFISKVGDKLGFISIHMNGGRILIEEGDYARAEASIMDALQLARAGSLTPDEVEALLRLADIAARKGDAEGARKRLAEMDPARMAKVRPDLAPDKEAVEKVLNALAPSQ
jgi:tetratricopeptide (TPR) repeat protein